MQLESQDGTVGRIQSLLLKKAWSIRWIQKQSRAAGPGAARSKAELRFFRFFPSMSEAAQVSGPAIP